MRNLYLVVALVLLSLLTPVYSMEDADARRAILQLRNQIKELQERLDKVTSEVNQMKSIEKNVPAQKNEPETTRSSEYLELRDEINAINRMLFKLMEK